jgi:uncharacterized Zn finger protein
VAVGFTAEALLEVAGEKCFRRGEEYLHGDAVSRLRVQEGELRALVQGTSRYRVRLGVGEDGGLEGHCTCPYARDGFFCKHAVAVGLAKLKGVGDGVGGQDDGADGTDGMDGADIDEVLHRHLQGLAHKELVDLVLEAAAADEEFENRLLEAAGYEWDEGYWG